MRFLSAAVLLALAGTALAAENMIFPADSGIVDVKAVYGAKGDGVTDDTAALQKAFTELMGKNATMYFPNGTYLIGDSLDIGGVAHTKTRFMNLQGQSEAGAIIKLKDKSAGYGDAKNPKVVVSTYNGASTGDAMHTYVRNLTVEVGAGNPGAAAMRFMSNNTGAIYNVTCRSLDPKGAGAIGLDLRQSQNGPALCKNITVIGFDRGVETGNTFSLVLEHITIKNQNQVGFLMNSARVTLRDLKSANSVPALQSGKNSQLTFIEGDLSGGAKDAAAIMLEGPKVFLRDIRQAGYGHIVKDSAGKFVDGEKLDEWHELPGYSLFGAEPKTLRLPIEETLEVPWEANLSKWVNVEPGEDKLQAAIDAAASAGKTTIYFPKGDKAGKYILTKPVRVYGSINRIIGMENILWIDQKIPAGETVLTFEDLKGPLVMERFFNILMNGGWHGLRDRFLIENKSNQPLVLRNFAHGACALKKPNPGKTLFTEDLGGKLEIGKGEKCWARQLNPESPDLDMVTVDGGQLWLLGLKTEGRAKHIVATNGAKVELLGGVSYQSWKTQSLDPPMFDVTDSDASFTFGFYHYNLPFTTIVQETLGGKTLTLPRTGLKNYHLPVYRTGSAKAGK